MPLSLRTPPREFGASREETVDDSIDVPAAVICAVCGDAGCPGCERELSRSGIVALIPWERSGSGAMGRLWATARATTMTGEAFFEILPDGPVTPALRFAMITELVAALGFVLSSLPLVAVLAPGWAAHVVTDPVARDIALRLTVVGIPALATLLVAAHVAHGLALDRGARKVGAEPRRVRALRFGLYATGWDLVMGPLGALILAFKEGLSSWVVLFRLSVGLPARCTRAFLRGAYRLDVKRVEEASQSGTVMAVVATFVGAVIILFGAAAIVLATG